MRENIKILLLEDSPTDIELISYFLDKNGYTIPILLSNDEKSFIKQLDENKPDVILSDHTLPQFNSLKAFDIAKRKYPDIVFIVVSGYISEDFAIELLNEGIDDYIMKDNLHRLPHAIESAYIKCCYKKESINLENANKELENAYGLIELKNRNITQSIIFAERIQTLTLPKTDILFKNFSESFVFYKPKDIVGGDFYWFTNRNERFVAVVADCTGHGVSGALLAMLGSNLLTEIIENKDNFDSLTDILMELDSGVCKLLKQNVNNNYHDSIDLAMISIDKENKKIYFCGCKRSLLFFIKKEKTIMTYKGEPYLIGGVNDRIIKTFKTQEIDYEDGDIIYMYTDGYVDQFGGDDNKKMMKDRFINLLLSFQHLELEYQCQLLEQKLIKWQGEFEQTDDILVVGIKL